MTDTQLSYASGASEQPLLGMTIGQKFDQACAQYTAQDAVVSVHQNRRISYAELRTLVDAFACNLLELGLKKVIALQSGHQTVWNGPLHSLPRLRQVSFWST